MARTVVADADVEVIADVSKLAGDLRKKLEPILKKITAVINTAADVDQFEKDVDKAIKQAEKKTASIKVEVDTKSVDKEVDGARSRINKAKPAKIKVEVEIDEDTEKASSGFLKRFASLGKDAGTRFVTFLGESISNGLTGLQEISTKLTGTVAQGLIGLAAAGATLAIGFPAAAGAVVALASAIATLLPLVIGLAAPLGALALVAGTLFIGLRDVQDALEGDEEALRRLTPSARSVLDVFSEFKPVLREIRDAAQEALFTGLSEPLRELGDSALPIVKEALVEIATTINGVLREAIDFFNSAEGNELLVEFFDDISESAKDIATVAPDAIVAVTKLISAGARLGRVVIPEIIDELEKLIDKLEEAADSGQLEKSFEDALAFARQLIEASKIIFNIIKLVGSAFLEGFSALIPGDEDQGKMDKFISALKDLEAFLENPLVQEGLSGIGTAVFALAAAFGVATIAVGLFIAALANIPGSLDDVITEVVDFTKRMREKWDEIGIDLGGMIANVTMQLSGLPGKAASALSGLTDTVKTAFNNAMNAAQQAILDGRDRAVGALNNIKTAIIGALFSLPSILYNSGQAMIQSLAQGILSQLGKARSAAGAIVSGIKGFFYNSPPKEGPMAGRGGVDKSAEIMLKAFTDSMLGEIPGISSATEEVVQAVSDAMGLGPTRRFIPPSFGNNATVSAPNLRNAAPLSVPRSSGTTGGTTTVNNARNTSATITIVAPTDDPTAIADRLVRRLLEARA
jgi:hypothetical protein